MCGKLIVTVFACLWCLPILLTGHGIHLKIVQKQPAVTITAGYHGSRTLADADVTVSFPAGEKIFQQGKTDANGMFSFQPDQPGQWSVTVDDGMGHRKTSEFSVSKDFFPVNVNPSGTKLPTDKTPTTPTTQTPQTTQTTPTTPTTGTAQTEQAEPKKQSAQPLKQDTPPAPGKISRTQDDGTSQDAAAGDNEMCCFLLKLLLGIIFILGITYWLYRLKKKKNEA